MLKKYCKLNDSNYCNINYIVYSPEKKDNNLPLLLFLHGIGERGNKVEERAVMLKTPVTGREGYQHILVRRICPALPLSFFNHQKALLDNQQGGNE